MSFAKVYVVDLCGPLLKVARERCAARGWHNVECVEADATTWLPDEGRGKVDLVTFSYSLTMIPDWFAAVDHAAALLADDGVVGAVDFYVARKHPAVGWGRHGWLTRTFWPVRRRRRAAAAATRAPLTPHTLPFAGVVRQRQRLSLVGAPAVPQDLCAVEGPRAREPRAVHWAAAARGAVLHLRRQAEGVAAIDRFGSDVQTLCDLLILGKIFSVSLAISGSRRSVEARLRTREERRRHLHAQPEACARRRRGSLELLRRECGAQLGRRPRRGLRRFRERLCRLLRRGGAAVARAAEARRRWRRRAMAARARARAPPPRRSSRAPSLCQSTATRAPSRARPARPAARRLARRPAARVPSAAAAHRSRAAAHNPSAARRAASGPTPARAAAAARSPSAARRAAAAAAAARPTAARAARARRRTPAPLLPSPLWRPCSACSAAARRRRRRRARRAGRGRRGRAGRGRGCASARRRRAASSAAAAAAAAAALLLLGLRLLLLALVGLAAALAAAALARVAAVAVAPPRRRARARAAPAAAAAPLGRAPPVAGRANGCANANAAGAPANASAGDRASARARAPPPPRRGFSFSRSFSFSFFGAGSPPGLRLLVRSRRLVRVGAEHAGDGVLLGHVLRIARRDHCENCGGATTAVGATVGTVGARRAQVIALVQSGARGIRIDRSGRTVGRESNVNITTSSTAHSAPVHPAVVVVVGGVVLLHSNTRVRACERPPPRSVCTIGTPRAAQAHVQKPHAVADASMTRTCIPAEQKPAQ